MCRLWRSLQNPRQIIAHESALMCAQNLHLKSAADIFSPADSPGNAGDILIDSLPCMSALVARQLSRGTPACRRISSLAGPWCHAVGWMTYPLVVPEVVELPTLLLLAGLPVLVLFSPSCLIPALLESVLLKPSAAAAPLHWSAVHQVERVLLYESQAAACFRPGLRTLSNAMTGMQLPCSAACEQVLQVEHKDVVNNDL